MGASVGGAERVATWRPDTAGAAGSQLSAFMRLCEERTGERFTDQAAFHEFSVAEGALFWSLLLEWSGLAYEGSAEPARVGDACETARFFPGVRLSYAENLLRIDSPADGERTAVIASHADRPPERLTRRELRARVLALAARLREQGVDAGDRVAAVAGNNAEVVVGALAAATIGATFSSAAPDMGAPAILDRFRPLEPVLLMANLRGGEAASTALSERVGEVAGALRSVRAVIALDDGPAPDRLGVPLLRLGQLLEGGTGALETGAPDDGDPAWPRFPFDHPLFVLFSSGTTGPPKCIVHGAGGTLLEHVKEHRLHLDLRDEDTLFFQTSAAWMMWNWQLSALATGSPIVLHDGPLTAPDTLWRVAEQAGATVLGTSPPYLELCRQAGVSPRRDLGLGRLRAVLSTGAILHDWQYDWVAEHVGPLPLWSISGGTDIIGCFVLGSPNLPVHRGWIPCRSLGMDVQPLPGPGTGELVCRNPFPSRPLGLLDDPGGTRFHDAYFAQNPGVWTHGDLIELDELGRARMHGRTDGVLNVNGVRIGPAEIVRALRDVPEVAEALAVEQRAPDGEGATRAVLLVVLRHGDALDGRLTVRIRREIARNASPAHVPDLVAQVSELPVTHSGKRSERAARDAVDGVPVANAAALRNPGSVDAIGRAVRDAAARAPLAIAPPPGDSAPTVERLRAIWEAVLEVAPLRPDDDFFDVGGTSLVAVRLFQAIHDHLGADLPLSAVLHARTIAAMAALIDGPATERAPTLVLLRPGDERRPLFLPHALIGDVMHLHALAQRLATGRAVYGLQARGLDPAAEPDTTVEAMARTYLASVRTVQRAGPYTLAGYSFGGLVAHEMARLLSAEGEEIEWLGLIDAEVHHRCLPPLPRLGFRAARPLRFLRSAIADPRGQLPRYARLAALRLAPGAPIAAPGPDIDLPPLQRRLEAISLEAFAAHRPHPYPGRATLFLADVRRPGLCDPTPVWRRAATGALSVERIPGGHVDLLAVPNVDHLARRIDAHLASGDGQASRAPSTSSPSSS